MRFIQEYWDLARTEPSCNGRIASPLEDDTPLDETTCNGRIGTLEDDTPLDEMRAILFGVGSPSTEPESWSSIEWSPSEFSIVVSSVGVTSCGDALGEWSHRLPSG